MDRLPEILEQARTQLDEDDRLREQCMQLSRNCIRACREAIGALHRGDREGYAEGAANAAKHLTRLKDMVGADSHIWCRGHGFDAQQEVVEMLVSGSIICGLELPSPDELQVMPLAWLHGLGDAIGELRREILERIRRGEVERAAELYGDMAKAYDGLTTFDYPDAVSHNLRRKVDVARSLLGRSQGDVVAALRQKELEERLKKA